MQGMRPHPLANFLGQILGNLGKFTQNILDNYQNLGKINILHPQKHSISYAYGYSHDNTI